MILTQNVIEMDEIESKGEKLVDHLKKETEDIAREKTKENKVFVLYFFVL